MTAQCRQSLHVQRENVYKRAADGRCCSCSWPTRMCNFYLIHKKSRETYVTLSAHYQARVTLANPMLVTRYHAVKQVISGEWDTFSIFLLACITFWSVNNHQITAFSLQARTCSVLKSERLSFVNTAAAYQTVQAPLAH